MSNANSSHQEGVAAPINDAIQKNRATAEKVRRAAEDLAAAHAVLDTQVPPQVRTGDVDKAVTEVKEVERRLDDATKVLHEVDSALKQTAQSKSPP